MKLNPYIAGNPVGGGEAFIGRADVLREVVRVLRNPNENALVLYGQRRIGKTSVLQELAARLPQAGPYRPVFFDLQDKAALPLTHVLAELAARMAEKLDLPSPAAWGEDAPRAFREEFIPQVLANLPGDFSLVLLFDEFDVLDNPGETQAGATFFPYLRNLLSLNPRLQFIFVIGRRPEDLSSLTLSVFKGVKSYSVSLMSPDETGSLVRLAERNGTLHWMDEGVACVYALTGGHPFLTQELCQQIWEQAYEDEPEEPPTIRSAKVEAAIPATLRSANNALEWLWDGLKPAERVVASALAGAGPQTISQEELNQRLLDSGVRILIGELEDAPRVLQEWDLIEPANSGYHFRVELLRRWLAERKPLARTQEEIDRIQPLAESYFQTGYGHYQQRELEQAISQLQMSTRLNPNHLRANQLLAEILLTQGELTEARQLLENLNQYHPAAARPRLVQVLLLQALEVREEEQLALYERVLELEPNQPEATIGRCSIWGKRGDELLIEGAWQKAKEAYYQAGQLAQTPKDNLKLHYLERKLRQIAHLADRKEFGTAIEVARELDQDFIFKDDLLIRLDRRLLDLKYEIEQKNNLDRSASFSSNLPVKTHWLELLLNSVMNGSTLIISQVARGVGWLIIRGIPIVVKGVYQFIREWTRSERRYALFTEVNRYSGDLNKIEQKLGKMNREIDLKFSKVPRKIEIDGLQRDLDQMKPQISKTTLAYAQITGKIEEVQNELDEELDRRSPNLSFYYQKLLGRITNIEEEAEDYAYMFKRCNLEIESFRKRCKSIQGAIVKANHLITEVDKELTRSSKQHGKLQQGFEKYRQNLIEEQGHLLDSTKKNDLDIQIQKFEGISKRVITTIKQLRDRLEQERYTVSQADNSISRIINQLDELDTLQEIDREELSVLAQRREQILGLVSELKDKVKV